MLLSAAATKVWSQSCFRINTKVLLTFSFFYSFLPSFMNDNMKDPKEEPRFN